MAPDSWWPTRRELGALSVIWTLVILRSVVYIAYEQASFDSDQAIIGLMAKHLIEGRAFPLFFYGQTYLLGVEAWWAAPFFAVFGASVATLHLSVLASNLLAATLIGMGLMRGGGLGPLWAIGSTAFFAFVQPPIARLLIDAGAANVSVFVYVPLLWALRRRPIWFGCVFAIGFLHREFAAYALPPIAIAEIATGVHRDKSRVLSWLLAVVVAAGTWQGIQALKPYADLMGPGTRGQLVGGVTGSQAANLADRMALDPAEWPARLGAMVGQHLPQLFGVVRVDASGAVSPGWAGWRWVFWLLLVGTALVAALRDVRARAVACPFGWYLAAVGVTAALGYVATRPAGDFVQRYVLLAVLALVGVVAVFAARASRVERTGLGALVGLWLVFSTMDHLAVARRFWPTPPPDDMRLLVDVLVDRGLDVAEAGYWRAYKTTFVSGERVIVASSDVVRIQEYRTRANQAGTALVRVQEQPCGGAGEAIGPWYLCTSP